MCKVRAKIAGTSELAALRANEPAADDVVAAAGSHFFVAGTVLVADAVHIGPGCGPRLHRVAHGRADVFADGPLEGTLAPVVFDVPGTVRELLALRN